MGNPSNTGHCYSIFHKTRAPENNTRDKQNGESHMFGKSWIKFCKYNIHFPYTDKRNSSKDDGCRQIGGHRKQTNQGANHGNKIFRGCGSVPIIVELCIYKHPHHIYLLMPLPFETM